MNLTVGRIEFDPPPLPELYRVSGDILEHLHADISKLEHLKDNFKFECKRLRRENGTLKDQISKLTTTIIHLQAVIDSPYKTRVILILDLGDGEYTSTDCNGHYVVCNNGELWITDNPQNPLLKIIGDDDIPNDLDRWLDRIKGSRVVTWEVYP